MTTIILVVWWAEPSASFRGILIVHKLELGAGLRRRLAFLVAFVTYPIRIVIREFACNDGSTWNVSHNGVVSGNKRSGAEPAMEIMSLIAAMAHANSLIGRSKGHFGPLIAVV